MFFFPRAGKDGGSIESSVRPRGDRLWRRLSEEPVVWLWLWVSGGQVNVILRERIEASCSDADPDSVTHCVNATAGCRAPQYMSGSHSPASFTAIIMLDVLLPLPLFLRTCCFTVLGGCGGK